MATTLIRNAQAIVTVDREDRVLRGENILVQDNVIRYIGPEEELLAEAAGNGITPLHGSPECGKII